MNKGIWLGCNIDKFDLIHLKDINTLFIQYKDDYRFVKKNAPHITHFVVNINHASWKQWIDELDAEYYYIDEPYLRGVSEATLIERRDYIASQRPNSKLVIGDIRHILKDDYRPIPGIQYTYTSYIGTFILFGIPIATGLPDQSNSIRRLHKIVNGEIPFIWLFGKNKWFCYPDEYKQLTETCEDLGIDMQILYMNTGTELQETCVTKTLALEYISAFIKGENAYDLFTWTKRFFKSIWVILKWAFNKL